MLTAYIMRVILSILLLYYTGSVVWKGTLQHIHNRVSYNPTIIGYSPTHVSIDGVVVKG